MADGRESPPPIEHLTALLQKVAKDTKAADKRASHQDILKALVHKAPGDFLDNVDEETWKALLEFFEKWLSGQNTAIPTKWQPDYENLVYCNTVADVQAKVRDCIETGTALRVAGAQHSAPSAVFAPLDQNAIRVKLDGDLRKIEWLEEDPATHTAKLKVGAGCNLGIDPSDPKSNEGNSLTRQLDARGYALPILGGMSHQTMGGYMSTSTAGGSISFGCADSILAIELVDGLGEVRVLDKVANPDEFNAAAVSMGLFGVFTHITITVIKKFLVKGKEETLERKNSVLKDAAAFVDAVRQNRYMHTTWFAAEYVDSVLQWTGNPVEDSPSNPIDPYEHPLADRTMNYAAAATLLATAWLTEENAPLLAAFIFNLVQRVGSRDEFCDHWYRALPNDDSALIDSVIRVQFTEIWLDLDDASKVLDALKKLFKQDPTAAGNFGVEIYPAKKSPFWMSMAYERDVIRIDPYWWEYNVIGTLESYFSKFWEILLPFPSARLHWGKHWPTVGKEFGGKIMGPDYVQKSYPKFGEWKALRAAFDPKGVFVTKYWDDLLGLMA